MRSLTPNDRDGNPQCFETSVTVAQHGVKACGTSGSTLCVVHCTLRRSRLDCSADVLPVKARKCSTFPWAPSQLQSTAVRYVTQRVGSLFCFSSVNLRLISSSLSRLQHRIFLPTTSMKPQNEKAYDITVFGATTFTGKLCIEHLVNHPYSRPSNGQWLVAQPPSWSLSRRVISFLIVLVYFKQITPSETSLSQVFPRWLLTARLS